MNEELINKYSTKLSSNDCSLNDGQRVSEELNSLHRSLVGNSIFLRNRKKAQHLRLP